MLTPVTPEVTAELEVEPTDVEVTVSLLPDSEDVG